jgi:putative ABC transport system permease protein
VSYVQPRSDRARHALARMPGVIAVEPQRVVAVRIRAGHRQRYLAVTGVPPIPRLKRIVNRSGTSVHVPPSGVVLSSVLADTLGVTPGNIVSVDVLEGHRPVRDLQVTGVVDDILGLSAYMDLGALHQMMREGDVSTGALLLVDSSRDSALSAELKRTPMVAGAAFKRVMLRTFRDVMAANMNTSIAINLLFAGIIAFGVVYNAARISLSERSRELASLRVLGYTRAEISLILLGELTLLTLLSLPIGGMFGYALVALIVRSIESEVYRFPLYVSRASVAWACLGITAASLISALVVRRRLDRLDLVAVLKVRE